MASDHPNPMGRRILDLKWSNPFRPIILKTTDGKRLRVRSQFSITVLPEGSTVYMYDQHNDRYEIPLASVATVEAEAVRRRTLRKKDD